MEDGAKPKLPKCQLIANDKNLYYRIYIPTNLMMSDRSFSKQSKEEGTSRSSSDLQWPPESQDFFGSIENMSMPESGNGSATG